MLNPLGIEGHYQDDGNGVYWVGPAENELLFSKSAKALEIRRSFEENLDISGTFTTTEGWVLNARRQDLDNLKNLYEFMTAQKAFSVPVKMADNSVIEMPITRLKQLCTELQGQGIMQYQKKWQKLAAVEKATTIEEVKDIRW